MEYVTDPVLFPGLRCPRCRAGVRAVRTAPSAKSEFSVALAEPFTWLVFGVAAAFGYFWQVVWGFTLAAVIVVPLVAVWLYVRSLMRGTFWCTACRTEFSYAEVSRSGRVNLPRE